MQAAASLLLLLLCAAPQLRAQSGDVNFPTPVFTSEVVGRIAPRDVGDPRRTRHFYTFRGTEGDLVVNVETSELIGDVDVFAATTLRPLVKFTLFGDPSRLSKSFYVRREETLVLRVEARAVGDAEGTYRISFGGSYAPAPAGLVGAPEPPAPTVSAAESRGTRRVTSTGARVEEPRTETPPAAEATAAASPTPTPERPAARRGSAASRRGRNTRTAPPRSRPGAPAAQPGAEAAGTGTAETRTPADNNNNATPETPAANAPRANAAARRRAPRPARRSSSRDRAATGEASAAEPPAPTPSEPAPTPAPAVTAQRLIIVTKDGETFEQDMSAVRRVTIEKSQVVVVMRDGKVTRRPLANVLKMSIEP